MKKHLVVLVCLILCLCTAVNVFSDSVPKRDFSTEEAYAKSLKQLGLFKGVSDTNLDLERAPTRIEALIMLIRVLGEEQKALDGTWRHPFTDVPEWADAYIGYAYVNRLTNGVSATEFGKGNATAATYLTFMLRALGYSDTAGADFSWNNPYDLAKSIGIITNEVDLENFLRADTAVISYAALSAKLKGSDVKLSDKLIGMGVFNAEQYNYYTNQSTSENHNSVQKVLNAEQIAEKCSPAVFKIYTYSLNGELHSSGTGFYISSDGYAITNHHVISNSCHFAVTTQDGTIYEDVILIDADEKNDLALIKINSDTSFPYLELDTSGKIKQGQTIYAIGNPLGYENIFTHGIISNTKPNIPDLDCFFITMSITSGSSGSPIINEYGQVIGVESAGTLLFDYNFVIPSVHINELDRSLTDFNFVWEDSYYYRFSQVYDFGDFTGASLLDRSSYLFTYQYRYSTESFVDIVSSNDSETVLKSDAYNYALSMELYKDALKQSGFKHTKIDTYTDLFESDTESVTIEYNLIKEPIITVTAELKPVDYEKHTGLLDFGWFANIEAAESNELSEYKCHEYKYNWSDYYSSTGFNNKLKLYLQYLTNHGYSYIRQEETDDGLITVYGNGIYRIALNINDTSMYIHVFIDAENLTDTEESSNTAESNDTPEETISDRSEKISYSWKKLKLYLTREGEYNSEDDLYFVGHETDEYDVYVVYYADYDLIGLLSFVYETEMTFRTYILLDSPEEYEIYFDRVTDENIISISSSINPTTFSEDKPQIDVSEFNGADDSLELYKDISADYAVSTLQTCEHLILKKAGISLFDIGFEKF